MVRLILFCMLVSGCTIQLHPVVQHHGAGQTSIASAHLMVPENGQKFSAHSILGISLVHDAAPDTDKAPAGVQVRIRSAVSAFLHCYYRSGDGSINRILPSGGYVNTYFAAGQTLTVPVDRRLVVKSDSMNDSVAVMCLAAEEELVDRLPLELAVRNTKTSLYNMNFDRLFTLYQHSTEKNLVARSIGLKR